MTNLARTTVVLVALVATALSACSVTVDVESDGNGDECGAAARTPAPPEPAEPASDAGACPAGSSPSTISPCACIDDVTGGCAVTAGDAGEASADGGAS